MLFNKCCFLIRINYSKIKSIISSHIKNLGQTFLVLTRITYLEIKAKLYLLNIQ
jgi:hypothetical protein